MKLLYITAAMPYGSGEAFFIPEVHELIRQGHEVLIVPRSPGTGVANRDAEALVNASLRLPLFSPRIIGRALLQVLAHPRASFRCLTPLLGSRNAETLVKNLAVFPKGLWLAYLAKRWGADHIHAQWGLTTATMSMVASQLSGIPWSCTVHRWDIVDNNLLHLKARDSQFFRVISEDGIALAAEVCGRPLEGNVIMLHLGVELPASQRDPPPLHSPPVLLCPAHLIERKGQKYLIEALTILRQHGCNVRLLLAGQGKMRDVLKEMVADYGLNNAVEFLGQMGHADLLDLYETGQIDMVVLPTLHEGIPVCLMEAMAYGVPVVSTNVGGIPELLRDGAGIVVQPKDPPALADAVERLLGDPELRKRLSKEGRRRVDEEFSVKSVVGKLLKYMQNAKQ